VLKLALDVTSIESIGSAIADTLSHFHRIDVVVNNAGYTLVGDTEAAGDAESRALMDTNFWGMVDVTKRAIGVMRDENPKNGGQQGGVVLNISSMGGWFGFPGSSFYHASKFAMEGWTEAVAKELPVQWNSKPSSCYCTVSTLGFAHVYPECLPKRFVVHLCNIEPGGVKTNYVLSSLKKMEKRHPAYDDPNYPTNALFSYMIDPKSRETWAEPEAIANAMYRIVSRGERIPIRIPLGPDSWQMIMADLQNVKRDLEDIKELSTSVRNPQ
jgi:NAD(P)-dependent dehydrogenase (short-subunit alcohol dehydrogenase family)